MPDVLLTRSVVSCQTVLVARVRGTGGFRTFTSGRGPGGCRYVHRFGPPVRARVPSVARDLVGLRVTMTGPSPYDPCVSQPIGDRKRTVEEALAQGVAGWSRAGSVLVRPLEELGTLDRAVYQAVAATSTPVLDGHFRRLSRAADHSVLWLGIAAAIAVGGGRSGRRAAVESVLAIGATSAVVNLGIKPLARRRRPDRADPAQFEARVVPMPDSTSFPSGHASSAFAFAYAVGRHLPELAVPVRLLAGGVAYSRVHTGVHYPGDVVIGAIVGAGGAAMIGAACDRVFQSGRGVGLGLG